MGAISSYYKPGGLGNHAKIELENLTLNEDKVGHYLTAKFKVEDAHSIREVDVPKIRLRIVPDKVSLRTSNDPYWSTSSSYINMGFGDLPLEFVKNKDGLDILYTESILEEKYTEMTMDEIEKKLGHKVKIVNK